MQRHRPRPFYRCLVATGLLVGSICCWAGEWTIIQNVNLSNSANLEQGNNGDNSNAIQALNVVKLANADGMRSQSSQGQMVSLGNANLTLRQLGAGNDNMQAANVLDVGQLDNVAQRVISIKHAKLQQGSKGNGNIQALNIANIERIDDIYQVATGTQVTLDNRGAAANNVQAINYLHAKGHPSSGAPYQLYQQTILFTLNIHTDGGFNPNGRYGQAANLIVHPNPSAAEVRVFQNTFVGYLNINGSRVDPNPLMLVLNRAVTP